MNLSLLPHADLPAWPAWKRVLQRFFYRFYRALEHWEARAVMAAFLLASLTVLVINDLLCKALPTHLLSPGAFFLLRTSFAMAGLLGVSFCIYKVAAWLRNTWMEGPSARAHTALGGMKLVEAVVIFLQNAQWQEEMGCWILHNEGNLQERHLWQLRKRLGVPHQKQRMDRVLDHGPEFSQAMANLPPILTFKSPWGIAEIAQMLSQLEALCQQRALSQQTAPCLASPRPRI